MKTAFDLMMIQLIKAIIATKFISIFTNSLNIKIGTLERVRGARRVHYSSFSKRISLSMTGRRVVLNACNSGEE